MNLSAVYELQNRLEMAAIAGVNLISEDFRLKRAVEQMAPLSGLSPVFKKIYGLSLKLISPDCEDPSGLLLDTLALVKAVCVTQGVLLTEGELEPIPEEGESAYLNFSYSVMAPVVEAFRGTGGGRYAVIRDAHETTPQLFDDYRIESLMVQALDDSYSDLADMVQAWLIKKGASILPSMKKNFRPDGKRDMARRLHIIDAVAGGKENEFYRSLLEKEEISKEVKEAAIQALRHDNGNAAFLLDLLKTEKGKQKEEVLRSLSYLDGPETKEYWSKAMKKKPVETAFYLANSKTDWASDLIADAVKAWIEEYRDESLQEKLSKLSKEQRQEDQKKRFGNLSAIWSCSEGKHSPKLCQCYETVYRLIPEKMPEVLIRSLILDPHPALCQVARQMYQNHEGAFLEPFAVMTLLTEPKEAAYEKLKQGIETKKDPDGIFKALERVSYKEEEGYYEMGIQPQMRNAPICHNGRRLEDGLDFRWYSFLLNSPHRYEKKWKAAYGLYRNRYDGMMAYLYRPDAEIQEMYGAYFYDKALKQEVTVEGIRMMKRCGWSNYKGILSAAAGKNGNFAAYYVGQILSELPLSNVELADELEGLIQRYKKQAVNGIGILEKWREDLKNGKTADQL